MAELLRVLAYPKFALNASDRNELLDEFLPICESVTIPAPPPVVPKCRDVLDTPFLELALAGHAEFLVTGDTDLLILDESFPVSILRPTDLEELLRCRE